MSSPSRASDALEVGQHLGRDAERHRRLRPGARGPAPPRSPARRPSDVLQARVARRAAPRPGRRGRAGRRPRRWSTRPRPAAWPASRAPPRRRARASAVVPGQPASSAMPSFGRSSCSGDAPLRERLGGRPGASVRRPGPGRRPRGSGTRARAGSPRRRSRPTSRGTAGVKPRPGGRPGDRTARGSRRPAPAGSGRAARRPGRAPPRGASHGAEPTARPSSRLRWCARGLRARSARGRRGSPWPVVTP